MRRRSRIEPRRIIFIGIEGPGERAFVQLLARCCDDAELHLHLEGSGRSCGSTNNRSSSRSYLKGAFP